MPVGPEVVAWPHVYMSRCCDAANMPQELVLHTVGMSVGP